MFGLRQRHPHPTSRLFNMAVRASRFHWLVAGKSRRRRGGKRMSTRFNWLIVFLVCFQFGCRNETSIEAKRDATLLENSFQGDPADLLRMVFRRYRNADAYHDRGEVELTFQELDRVESRRAPLSVAFDRGNLDVSAYSLLIKHNASRSMAWMDKETSDRWKHQVLLGPSTGRRPDLDQLLADPVLSDELSGGGAGPPPQLEWLFAADPMAGLFASEARFEVGSSTMIDQRNCVAIEVTQDVDRFVFWIDQPLSLIRRIDLPAVVLPMRDTTGVVQNREIKLSVHLTGADFRAASEPSSRDDFPTKPRWVRRLVPPPPAEPDWPSWTIHELRLIDARGQRLGNMPTTIPSTAHFVLIKTDSIGHAIELAGFLQAWSSQMPSKLRETVSLGISMPESASTSELREIKRLDSVQWISRHAAESPDPRFPIGAVVVLDRRGHVQWMQSTLNAASLPLFGTVLADLSNGIDVRKRIADQFRATEIAYLDAIDAATIRR